MHIAVDVSAVDPKTGVKKMTTRCLIVFVALDDAGDRVSVPKWEPQSEEDILFQKYAINMAQLGKQNEFELLLIDSKVVDTTG
jgi:acyl-CoA hydrolase